MNVGRVTLPPMENDSGWKYVAIAYSNAHSTPSIR